MQQLKLELGLARVACAHCAGPVPPSVPRRKFCKHDCKRAYELAQEMAERVAKRSALRCKECGATFAARTSSAQFCKEECYRAHLARKRRARYQADPEVRRKLSEYRKRKSPAGKTFTTQCKRCSESFSYTVIRKRRTVCELCREHDAEWRDYRLTGREAQELRSRNACDICGRTKNPGGRFNEWHIDHCHDTKRVRGLLCAPCNTVLGLMEDDPARLRAAADYLEA